MNDYVQRAARCRQLRHGGAFALPNAWDAASTHTPAAGSLTIATTSTGVAWNSRLPDAQAFPREELCAVGAPVSADIEAGDGAAVSVLKSIPAGGRKGRVRKGWETRGRGLSPY